MKNIKTKEFILRHIQIADAKDFLGCFQDKVAKKNFITHPKNLEDSKRKIRSKIRKFKEKKGETFVIIVDNKFAGYVELNDLNGKHSKHRGNIGYCTHKNFRGKGLTTKAVKLVVSYAFKKYKLKRLEAMCRTFNKASARILEKCGFQLEGILRKNKCVNGKYLNDMIWAKIK